MALIKVAGDAFCHAELRVCWIDRSGVPLRTLTSVAALRTNSEFLISQRALRAEVCHFTMASVTSTLTLSPVILSGVFDISAD